MPSLNFDSIHVYSARVEGISLPVTLTAGAERATILAFIDTGASNCLFERAVGEALGLDVESGESKWFSAASGRVQAFGHFVSIQALGLSVHSIVYFFADERIAKNLLGRAGWLDRIRFGLVEYDRTIYVAEYNR